LKMMFAQLVERRGRAHDRPGRPVSLALPSKADAKVTPEKAAK
jgi:hypothetical protein